MILRPLNQNIKLQKDFRVNMYFKNKSQGINIGSNNDSGDSAVKMERF